METHIVRTPIRRDELTTMAEAGFGEMVKAVVDIRRRIIVLGGELHSDEEAILLEDGSAQRDLWGINLYPEESDDTWIEFDSLINIRPTQGNRSRGVDDDEARGAIREIVRELIIS